MLACIRVCVRVCGGQELGESGVLHVYLCASTRAGGREDENHLSEADNSL